jgi:hypothetical protein
MIRPVTRISIILFLLSFLLPCQLPAGNMITLTVPDAVLSQALDKSLPIAIDTNSSTLSGAITIIKISNLKLQDKGLSCRVALKGDDMQLSTEISGHALKLKVGSLELDLQCNAGLRFDPAKQMLYIKPTISELQATSSSAQGDINAILMAYLNNREFQIKLQHLEPLIAETSNKTINISMNIVGIQTRPGILQFDILPHIQSTNHGAKKKT